MMRNTTATITTMKRIMSHVNPEIPLSKLVFERCPASLRVMAPKYVRAPVFTTTPRAVPESTLLPWKQALGSSSAAFARGRRGVGLFSTGIDSPVRALWLTKKSFVEIRRRSAGTRDPASRTTMSPGTTSASGISVSLPSREHVHRGAHHGLELFHGARPDLSSWTEESPTLMRTMPPTTMVERRSPMMKETPAMTRSWMTRGLAKRW